MAHVFAAPFQNLDFEQANINTTTFITTFPPFLGTGPTADLLPGWQIYHRGLLQPTIGYNYFPQAAGGMLLTHDNQSGWIFGSIDGNYAPVFTPDDQPFYLIQQGDIPTGATRMTFNNLVSGFDININGLDYPIGNATSSIDISQFAGKNVTLEFIFSATDISPGSGVDSIAFIPEPSTLALLGLGGLAFAFRCFRRGGRRVDSQSN